MDDERSDDAVSAADEALDALRAELSVAPSPDFHARVRARVARPRAARRWGWIVPALAAAVLLIAAIVWMRAPRIDRTPSVARETPAPPPGAADGTPAPTPPAEPVPEPRRRAAPRTASQPAIEPIRPIVPPGEELRLARYVASVRQRPFEADTLPESDPRELLADPAPIEIAPLKTAPLVPEEGSLR